MRTTRVRVAVLVTALAAITLPARALSAQAARTGPREGPLVLRLPTSARFAAMANAAIASNDGDALLHNPGMLSVARGSAVSVQRYGRHATAGALGTVSAVGSLFVGVGAQFVEWSAPAGASYPDLLRGGATTLSDSNAIPSSSTAFTFGVARTVKGLRLGVNVKYAEDRIGAAHDGTVAVDVGLVRPMGPANLGIVVQNVGAGTRLGGSRVTLPTRFGVGWGGGLFPLWEHWDLGAQVQVTVEGRGFVRPAGGVELGYVPIEGVSLVVRSGLRLPRERDESLVTGGLGIVVDRFSLDYAAEPMRGGRPVSHRVGLRIR